MLRYCSSPTVASRVGGGGGQCATKLGLLTVGSLHVLPVSLTQRGEGREGGGGGGGGSPTLQRLSPHYSTGA